MALRYSVILKKMQLILRPSTLRNHTTTSNLNLEYLSNLQENKILSTRIAKEFNENMPNFIQETKSTVGVQIIADRLEEVIKYNMQGGKRIRPTLMLESYTLLEKPENLTQENMDLAKLLAWCMEMFGTAGGMTDDIVDQSMYRRGSVCWYKKSDVGMRAVNDSILTFTSLYMLLYKHFGHKSYYIDLLELFDQMNINAFTGQCLDDQTNLEGKPVLSTFTMDYFKRMVRLKTTEYTLFTPMKIVLMLAGKLNDQTYGAISPILEEIGLFFQIQNDYQDCYDQSSNTGKDGNDISQGKCSWFVIKALEIAGPEDRKILEENYGVNDEESVKRVIGVYNKLNLLQEFRKYEENSLNLINKYIDNLPKDIPAELIHNMVRKFHKRV